MMIARILKGIAGVALVAFACIGLAQAMHELPEIRRLLTKGGSQDVFFGEHGMTVNAKLLGVLIMAVPVVSLVAGLLLCASAFPGKDEDNG